MELSRLDHFREVFITSFVESSEHIGFYFIHVLFIIKFENYFMTSISVFTSKNNSKATLTQFLIKMEPALTYLVIIVRTVSNLWLIELINFIFLRVVFKWLYLLLLRLHFYLLIIYDNKFRTSLINYLIEQFLSCAQFSICSLI